VSDQEVGQMFWVLNIVIPVGLSVSMSVGRFGSGTVSMSVGSALVWFGLSSVLGGSILYPITQNTPNKKNIAIPRLTPPNHHQPP